MSETTNCPQCGTAMALRLGEYECPQCGTRIPKEQLQQRRGIAAPWEQAQQALHGSKPTIPQAAPGVSGEPHPGYARIGLKSITDAEPSDDRLRNEKGLFMIVFIAVQVGIGFLYMARTSGADAALLTLPSFIVSAVASSIGAGIVLYIDNSCIKNSCLVLIGLNVLLAIVTIFMAWRTHQLGLAGGLILNTLLYGWLVSILNRDTQFD